MIKDELGLGKLVERLQSRKGEAITRTEKLMDEAADAITALIAERDAATALPSQVVGDKLFSMLQAAYLRGIAFARENGATPAEERKAAYDYADKTTSCLTSLAAEPVDVTGEQVLNVAGRIQSIMSEKLTVEEGEIIGVGPCSYKIARLFKPAPSPYASREVTERIRAILDHPSKSPEHDLGAIRAALLSALSTKEG